MGVYKVSFTYSRTVTTYLEAEDEEEIEDFLDDNEDWDVLEHAPEIIDEDETSPDYDYSIEREKKVVANYAIEGGQIVEVDS